MRERVRRSAIIDPAGLSQEERKTFSDRLYHLHTLIFDGVPKDNFISHVVNPPAEWTRIRIYTNSQNQWVGYCAVHRFKVSASGRTCMIIRAEAGLLSKYRGRSQTLWFGFRKAIAYKVIHPFSRLYYLGSFVHPSVSYMFSRYFSEYYPRADSPVPDKTKALMLELANTFHLQPVEGRNFLVRKIGWTTRETDKDQRFWQKHQHPMVKFYLETNPDYANGNGLLMLVPLTFKNTFASLTRYLLIKIKKNVVESPSH